MSIEEVHQVFSKFICTYNVIIFKLLFRIIWKKYFNLYPSEMPGNVASVEFTEFRASNDK